MKYILQLRTRPRKNSINIAKPAKHPSALKESVGVVQKYDKWNVIFLNSSRITIYCD